MKRRIDWLAALALAVAALVVAAVYAVWALNRIGEAPLGSGRPVAASPEVIARGAYLARIGDCASCHTQPGGADYAGGRAIQTPFGAVYSSNLTPDDATGLGHWTPDEFWRALHNGRSRDGRLLYPAFPYTEYTHVTREDADAIFSYLRSLAPVRQEAAAHQLGFPYSTQAALAVWRALYFRPGRGAVVQQASPELTRGAYLVQGLGHCASCHTPRNALGGLRSDALLGGGLVEGNAWWAPSLTSTAQAGVSRWAVDDIAALLTRGVSASAGVSGPMAEVVFSSLQYLTADDARAMAAWLRQLPQVEEAAAHGKPPPAGVLERGHEIYHDQCAQCHGDEGEGKPGAFPALAGNRAVRMAEPLNLVQIVLHGGYLPATAGNPQPYGMPPFRQSLSDDDVADVLSFIREAWGNGAPPVDIVSVHRARERSGS